jgi:2-polyprenyl-6-methoxyphenol hydroxylase-like FAD-dependent oxidoreductase
MPSNLLSRVAHEYPQYERFTIVGVQSHNSCVDLRVILIRLHGERRIIRHDKIIDIDGRMSFVRTALHVSRERWPNCTLKTLVIDRGSVGLPRHRPPPAAEPRERLRVAVAPEAQR